MTRRNKNPFSVLGLAPSALDGLNDIQIDILVTRFAKIMQLLHHPDTSKKKSTAKSIAISKAVEALDRKKYPEAFRHWKESFLKKTPMVKKIEDAETLAKNYHVDFVELSRVTAALLGRKAFHSDKHLLDIRGKRIHIHNPWISIPNLRWVMSSSVPGPAFFFLEVDKDCRVVSYDEELVQKKFVIGSIEGKAYLNTVSDILKKFFADTSQRMRLSAQKARTTGKTSYRGPVIEKDTFHLIAKYVRHDIASNGYIVTINQRDDADGSIFFQIEGSVKEIL